MGLSRVMFERNRVDNRAETVLAVEIGLSDGTKIAGRASIGAGKPIQKLLEGDDAFIYVETFEGDGLFVPKPDIRGLKVINTGRAASALLPMPDARSFEPYRVLGLEPGASFEQIRDAYHRLSKTYHPDRFASVSLPREMAAYLEAVLKNVNAAFRALKHVEKKSAPVYSRG